MARILVIDDDRLLRGAVELILRLEGHDVACVSGGREGLAQFRADRFDLVACDIFMPNMEGLETISEIRALAPELPIIAFTGGPDYAADAGSVRGFLRIARQLPRTEVLAKPFRSQELLALVRRCLRARVGA
jgi:two-component system response regulator (stage 0 sporulation protein F)